MTKEEMKERNESIVKDYLDWHDEDHENPSATELMQALSKKYDLTQVHIYNILRDNASLIMGRKDYYKFLRICKLRRMQMKKGEKSSKDVSDLMEQERKELEGEKSLVDQSQHITQVIVNVKEMNEQSFGTRNRLTPESV